MPIINQGTWGKWVDSNKDPYGKACVDVAREVMRMLDEPAYENFDPHRIICDADKKIGAGGITGFMAGCVAEMVFYCHSRGEEFRRAWNKHYGVEEGTGVVNPAIMVIGTEEEKDDTEQKD